MKTLLFSGFFLGVLIVKSINAEPNHLCSFRGCCIIIVKLTFRNFLGLSLPVPCVNQTELQKLTQNVTETLALLRPYVAELVKHGADSLFCYDEEQIADMFTQMATPKALLNRCPACFYNFIRIFLHMACSPRQHEFVRVTDSNKVTNEVNSVDYYIDQQNAEGMYNSCVGVKDPETGDGVLETILCIGLKPNETCTSEKFMKSMDGKSWSPFQINLKHHVPHQEIVPRIVPLKEKAVSCADTLPGFASCNWVDCKEICPKTGFQFV